MTLVNGAGEVLTPREVLDGTYQDYPLVEDEGLFEEVRPSAEEIQRSQEIVRARKEVYLAHEAMADEFQIPLWD